jgi:hypothetical protein
MVTPPASTAEAQLHFSLRVGRGEEVPSQPSSWDPEVLPCTSAGWELQLEPVGTLSGRSLCPRVTHGGERFTHSLRAAFHLIPSVCSVGSGQPAELQKSNYENLN